MKKYIKNQKKKNKRILKYFVFVIFVIAVYCGCACVPLCSAEKECDVSSGGFKVEISGRDIWYNIYNENSEETPIYVIAGGMGLSSDYLESGLMFLAENHPIIFYDGRCAGRSEYTRDLSDCTFENYAKDLEALRKYLTPDKDIIIISHSYGGAAAMQYVVDYQENVESMIFISSVGIRTGYYFSDAYFHTGVPPLDQNAANQWFIDNIGSIYGGSMTNSDCLKIFENTKINYSLMIKNNGLDKYDFSEQLKDVNVPCLVLVGGEKDTGLTNLAIAKELNDTLPNSEIFQFQNSGHFCFFEEYDSFKDKISEFLKK